VPRCCRGPAHSATKPQQDRTGGPPFPLLLLNSFLIRNVGAPSLRFLQGWAAMLHALLDRLRRDKDQQTCASVSDSHPSHRTRRMGHPSLLVNADEIKSLGHPPNRGIRARCRVAKECQPFRDDKEIPFTPRAQRHGTASVFIIRCGHGFPEIRTRGVFEK